MKNAYTKVKCPTCGKWNLQEVECCKSEFEEVENLVFETQPTFHEITLEQKLYKQEIGYKNND